MGLIFDNVDLEATYGVIVDGVDTWPKPERDVEMIHVPGRNGDLLMDNGCWKNVTIPYRFLIKDNWKTNFENFAGWLCSHVGYFKLEDPDRHPGVYRMASFTGPLDPDLWFVTDTGVFTVNFDCKPQQFIDQVIEIDTQSPLIKNKRIKSDGSIEAVSSSSFLYGTTALFKVYSSQSYPTSVTIYNSGTSSKTFDVGCASYTVSQSIWQVSGSNSWSYSIPAQSSRVFDLSSAGVSSAGGVRVSFGSASGYEKCTVTISRQGKDDVVYKPTDSISFTITNPTNYESAPDFECSWMGGFSVNDLTVSISGAYARNHMPIIIKGELETCYYKSSGDSANSSVSITNSNARDNRDFPYFKPGDNELVLGEPNLSAILGDVDFYEELAIKVTPNWYKI